jgi:hypothetical protein
MTTKTDYGIRQRPTKSDSGCATCPMHNAGNLLKLGVDMSDWDYVVALAGNPNTGKSTVFNALTGLRQHTGNWPGKTVARAEGGFSFADARYKLVDLPGTYSLYFLLGIRLFIYFCILFRTSASVTRISWFGHVQRKGKDDMCLGPDRGLCAGSDSTPKKRER